MSMRPSLAELRVFAAIVRHASFRAAADELEQSPSSLSHTMRGLEDFLGVRLFNRTTRSVAPTEAGARLFSTLTPILAELDHALADVGHFRDSPSGTLRINASESSARILMKEIVPSFARRYPDVHLDLVTEGRVVDIVAEGFDAGVRLGEAVPQDMIAVPFGGDARLFAVAAPDYLDRYGVPQTPDDLSRHNCIRFRLPSGKIYRWEFEQVDHPMKIDVQGTLTLDHMALALDAAIKGLGIAYVFEEIALPAIAQGRLVPLLEHWSPGFSGYSLYYPSRRLMPNGLRAFVDTIRSVEQGSRVLEALSDSPG